MFNCINENIPVDLNFRLRAKEKIHNFFKKPYIVKLFTYLPTFLFGKYKKLALLIMRSRQVFENTVTHHLPHIQVYGGDKLSTLQAWESRLREDLPENLTSTHTTKILFEDVDSLTAARQVRAGLADKAEKIAIVNFANRWQEGGVAEAPYGGSQEEFLARHSNMAHKENFASIHQQLLEIRLKEGYSKDESFHHHIPYFGTVLATNVTFIQDADNVRTPTQFDQFDTIWTAAVDNRKGSDEALFLHKHCGPHAETARYKAIEDKLRAVFNTAIAAGHQHLILGAYGCGCFQNDSAKVADIMERLIHQNYQNRFKSIVFSITDQAKLQIFKNAFNKNQ